jgi:membrane-bound serine protease (ClpP class)
MAPGTNIGAAHPVAMGGGQMDDVMKEKVENDSVAYIRSLTEKRGRNAHWAEDAVRKSVSITEKEALKLNVIDLISENLDGLLKAVDGREVTTVSGKVILSTRNAEQMEFPMGTRLRILNLLSDPNVAYVLMLLGIYGLFFELASPGAILPGVVGAISLILAFYAFQTLPVNYAGLLLILLGIILFIAEIKIVSYGLLSVAGIISMILGSLMLVDTDVPFFRISWAVIFPMAAATALFFSVVIGLAVRAHRKPPVSGKEGLIGSEGEAYTDVSHEGKVFLHGEIWDARSDTPIPKGARVRVLEMNHLTLTVRKAGGPDD